MIQRKALVLHRVIDPMHTDYCDLHLPTDRVWYEVAIKGEWFARAFAVDWAYDYLLEAIGTISAEASAPALVWENGQGATTSMKLWRARIGKPTAPLYLDALWRPEWEAQRVVMAGLEGSHNEKDIRDCRRGLELLVRANFAGRRYEGPVPRDVYEKIAEAKKRGLPMTTIKERCAVICRDVRTYYRYMKGDKHLFD